MLKKRSPAQDAGASRNRSSGHEISREDIPERSLTQAAANRLRAGTLLGWASVNFAEARRELIQGVLHLSKAGLEPDAGLADIIDDVFVPHRFHTTKTRSRSPVWTS
jgi:hypothetical protein